MSDEFDPTSIIGEKLPPSKVTIERGPVSNFAIAVTDENPVYQNADTAAENGFDGIPAPPTFGFAMTQWGKYPEDQPDGADKPSPMMNVIGKLMGQGGLVLHGEEEFVYHRPIVAGDVLTSSGEIKDVYTKEGGSKMTFVVAETDWTAEDGEKVLTERMTLLHKA